MKIGFVAAFAGAALTWAAGAAAHPAPPTDFSGFWELQGELPKAPPAPLTPDAKRRFAELVAARRAKNGPVAPEARWCRFFGMPFIMSSSPPINLVQNDREMVLLSEWPTAARHIYLDGRKFPPEEEFDQTSNGFSIGHFVGKDLVVETKYFTPQRGIPLIPGGAFKTLKTHLEERYHLLPDGQQLQITFTWTDPDVFERPHTYAFTYHRSPPGTFALEGYCDAEDPQTGGLGETPEQIPQ